MTRRQQKMLYTASLVCLIFFLIYPLHHRFHIQDVSASISKMAPVIVIDAGHGGEDGGAISSTGKYESVINLSIAKKAEQFIAFCGMDVLMIRSEDISVATTGDTIRERKVSDLKNRVELINSIPNAILISIHQNHFSEEQYRGAQVFFAPTQDSREFATRIQNTIRQSVDLSNHRDVKAASSVYLMNNLRCPGVLVECGFLSNREEAQLLEDNTYQKKLALSIGSALTQFVNERNLSGEV